MGNSKWEMIRGGGRCWVDRGGGSWGKSILAVSQEMRDEWRVSAETDPAESARHLVWIAILMRKVGALESPLFFGAGAGKADSFALLGMTSGLEK